MNTILDKPTSNKKTDWLQAKMLYMQDNTLSYADIGKMFGVSLKQVKKHGIREDWVWGRQEVAENVEIAIKEKTVDQRLKINEKHQKQYELMQTTIETYLYVIHNHNKYVIKQAKAEGRLPNPKELYSPQKLFYLVKAMKKAIEGERVTVELPTIVVATEDWRGFDELRKSS